MANSDSTTCEVDRKIGVTLLMTMDLQDIIKIFIFLLGTALQISLLVLMSKRKGNKKREIIFALFSFIVLIWTFGIFTSLFCGYLYRGINVVEQSLGAGALVGFILIFPLLNHSLLNFMEYKKVPLHPARKYIILMVIYTPVVIFLSPLWPTLQKPSPFLATLEDFIQLFLPCLFFSLALAWGITIHLYRKIEAAEEKRFLRTIAGVITLGIILYFVSFVLPRYYLRGLRDYCILATEAFTFLMPPLLAHYLFYYNYIEYVFKRGIIYCVLGIFVIAFYLSVIRPLGATLELLQINFRMVEGILVMALVFFFDPLKRWLHELSNRIFFSERSYYRKIFSEISLMIAQATYMDLETLLTYVASTLSRAMKIREVSFIFFERNHEQLQISESTLAVLPQDIGNIIDYIEKHRAQVLNIYALGENETETLREMRKIKAFTIIGIYNENKLIGMLSLGKRLIRHQLLAEEEEMLIVLINQMVTSLENTRLAREKFTIERKMYENEKLSSLGRLSASIAHEVKNPLSSIKTIVQVMKEELAIHDANQEGLSLVIEEIDRLSRVVNQLLRFARPHSPSLARINLSEALQNVLLLLKHEAERNHVAIHNFLDNKELWMVSDKDAFCEIFFNLIHNSIQALPQGGFVNISYKVQYAEDKNELPLLQIYVTDNGPGIPPNDREKVFEPFYTTRQKGTGLGLTIVRDRVQRLRGKITIVDSNEGAVFEIAIPWLTTMEQSAQGEEK